MNHNQQKERNQKRPSLHKRFRTWLINGVATEEVMLRNDVSANMMTASILIISAGILLITLLLTALHVYQLELQTVVLMNIVCLPMLLVPVWVCRKYHGKKQWLKLTMIVALLLVYGWVDVLLSFRAALLMVIPVVVSSRYYSKRFTIFVGALSTLIFALSASLSIRFGDIDLNNVMLPAGSTLEVTNGLRAAVKSLNISWIEQETRLMRFSYLPKFLLFCIVNAASVGIADYGYRMVTEQAHISEEHTRVETELTPASRIQERSLPIVHKMQDREEFEIAARMHPAKEVGGDFYDFFFIDERHLALMIADVSGKGVPAALFMMVSKIMLDNSLQAGRSPAAALTEVNRQLCEKELDDMFVTVWLGVLDITTGELVHANAGHENPFVCRKNGEFEVIRGRHGFVLGGMENMRYREETLTLAPGDMVFVYTDGVLEANDPAEQLYGEARALSALNAKRTAPLDEMLDSLKRDIDRFAGTAPQFDDTTMLALRLNHLADPAQLSREKAEEGTDLTDPQTVTGV